MAKKCWSWPLRLVVPAVDDVAARGTSSPGRSARRIVVPAGNTLASDTLLGASGPLNSESADDAELLLGSPWLDDRQVVQDSASPAPVAAFCRSAQPRHRFGTRYMPGIVWVRRSRR